MKRQITKKWKGCQFELGDVVTVCHLSPIMSVHSVELEEEKPEVKSDDKSDELRDEYHELSGKRADHRWSDETLQEKIEEIKAK